MPPVNYDMPTTAAPPHEPVVTHHHHPEPPPPPPPVTLSTPVSDEPVPVIRVLSVRGVEYAMMTIALWFAATGLGWVLLNVANGSSNFDFLVVPLSVLITTLPVFSILFLRLKRAELANPQLRLEPSKRRLSQLTQVLAFIVCMVNLTVFVYSVLQKINGSDSVSIGKSALSLVIILAIAGGILAYYWFDEHRARRA